MEDKVNRVTNVTEIPNLIPRFSHLSTLSRPGEEGGGGEMIDPESEVEEFSEVGKKIIGIGPSTAYI